MSLSAGRVGVRADQVDSHGRAISPSFLNEIMEDLPEWTDLPVRVNGTEQLIPSNPSVPVTSPILADIDYPDERRNDQYFTYRESPTTVDGLAKIKGIRGNTLVWNQQVNTSNITATKTVSGITLTNNEDGTITISGASSAVVSTEIANGLTLENGHVYFLGRGKGWAIINGYASDGYGIIKHNRDTRTAIYFYCTSGTTINQTFGVQCIDLTKMFGSTKADEIYQMELSSVNSGVNYIKSLFPLPYYAYNSGSLLSFNGTAIKTTNEGGTEEHTTNLPTETYFPTGMKSAGSVYDELLPTKAVTRIGTVDLGTLNWTYDSTVPRFYTTDINSLINKPVNDGTKANAVSMYMNTTFNQLYATEKKNMTMAIGATGTLSIINTSYSNATAFKTAMSGVYLYYELATPVELPTLDFGE